MKIMSAELMLGGDMLANKSCFGKNVTEVLLRICLLGITSSHHGHVVAIDGHPTFLLKNMPVEC
jgi:hypothetical protein